MNVLIASGEYPPYSHFGGLGTHTRLLAEGLVCAGHRVVVVSTHYRRTLTIQRESLHLVLYDAREFSEFRGTSAQFFERFTKAILATLPDHLESIGFRPDVVHSQAPHFLTALAELGDLYSCPIVATAHTSVRAIANALGRPVDPQQDEWDRSLCSVPDLLICVSKALKELFSSEYGARPERIRTVINGVDVAGARARLTRSRSGALRNRLAGSGKIVVQAGHLNVHKGLFAMLDSARDVLAQGVKVRYLLAGPMAHECRDRFTDAVKSDLRLAASVRWLGVLKHESALKLMAIADALLFPTLFDACGYVALEAQVHGTPVIASSVGGVREVIEHGITGLLIPPLNTAPPQIDVNAFTEAQISLLQDDQKRRMLGEHASQLVSKRFSQSSMVHETVECYRFLLSRGGKIKNYPLDTE